jgi:DNA polymerase-3 subunit alpha (Gram-positive type)
MVKDAPKIDEALPGFFEFLEDHILVAHNATFDY